MISRAVATHRCSTVADVEFYPLPPMISVAAGGFGTSNTMQTDFRRAPTRWEMSQQLAHGSGQRLGYADSDEYDNNEQSHPCIAGLREGQPGKNSGGIIFPQFAGHFGRRDVFGCPVSSYDDFGCPVSSYDDFGCPVSGEVNRVQMHWVGGCSCGIHGDEDVHV